MIDKDKIDSTITILQAYQEGKTLQYFSNAFTRWEDAGNHQVRTLLLRDDYRWRVKPEVKKGWCRVALFKTGTINADNLGEEKWLQGNSSFIRWLTDRIEYDLPEESK